MWTATLDRKDDNAKGGFARTQIAAHTDRAVADSALREAVAAHLAETGHTARPTVTFPGATWTYCSCGAAFHTARR